MFSGPTLHSAHSLPSVSRPTLHSAHSLPSVTLLSEPDVIYGPHCIQYSCLTKFWFEAIQDLFRTLNAGSTLCSTSHLEKLAVADRSTSQVPSSVIAFTEAHWIITTSLGTSKCEATSMAKAWGQRRSPARRRHPRDDGSVGPLTTPKSRPNSIIPAKALCSTV